MTYQTSNAPFRADIVGSFLRPQEIKVARAAFENGEIDSEGLKAIEDKCIAALISKQKESGIKSHH